MNLIRKINKSAHLFRNTKALCLAAMLTALMIVLSAFDIPIVPEALYLSFDFLALASIGMLLGPAYGMACGAVADVLSWAAFPKGGFFPGYTLSAVAAGLIYGGILFENPKSGNYLPYLLARGLVNLICNCFLNTLWVELQANVDMSKLMFTRLWKNLLMLPVEALVLYAVSMVIIRVKPNLKS